MPVNMPLRQSGFLSPEDIFAAADFGGEGGILVAVSGGGDSLALLFLLQDFLQARGEAFRLAAVTIDHKLRAESAQEADYVADLCAQAGIKHKILRWQGAKPQTGLQAAARAARYQLLRQAAAEFGAVIICTAHTLDDQAETYAMRRQRIDKTDFAAPFADIAARGLAGIAPCSLLGGKFWLMRPLLSVSRADLRIFLQQKSIKWLDDPSNKNKVFERVRIREAMTLDRAAMNAKAAESAAAVRLALSRAAARLGVILGLQTVKEKAETVFVLDLKPLQSATGKKLEKKDLTALYLLLAVCAALMGNRSYISPKNVRLQQFLPLLTQEGKGEKPLRISVSGAVLEKRKARLVIRREKRNFLGSQAKIAVSDAFYEDKTGLDKGLFEIVSLYDAPLYQLLCPLLLKQNKTAAATVSIGQNQEKRGKFTPVSWQSR